MLSLIEVQCPHCGARGQIMVPPVGAMIIGPCPQCDELVVVFCGHVLPLDRAVMETGEVDERREHLLSILTEFLQDRIHKLLSDESDLVDGEFDGGEEADFEGYDQGAPTGETSGTSEDEDPISETEFEQFTDVDLKLLDNKAYFKSVFEGS